MWVVAVMDGRQPQHKIGGTKMKTTTSGHTDKGTSMKAILIILLIVLILLIPFLFVWGLNTLFGLGIAYTLKTWLATLIVVGTISSVRVLKS